MKEERYEDLVLDEERALYGVHGALIRRCAFRGPADGESALKECGEIQVEDSEFLLRYPLWHVTKGRLLRCRMEDTCRAALWYDRGLSLENCELNGIKALRECDEITLKDCRADSQEFGWFCRGVKSDNLTLKGEYPFLQGRNLEFDRLNLTGKYSFQYVEHMEIKNSVLDTKDAFWHSRNVTVTDSVVKGEYLAWYSENLRLVRCRIIGTQPLCYCKGLTLEDCEMEGTDLSFENSEVNAAISGDILSVKNPLHGRITAGKIGEVILDENLPDWADCQICQGE